MAIFCVWNSGGDTMCSLDIMLHCCNDGTHMALLSYVCVIFFIDAIGTYFQNYVHTHLYYYYHMHILHYIICCIGFSLA